MGFLIYFIFPLLFLNFNFKNISKGEQIGRYILGLIYSFIVFYLGNADRSISFILANIKFIAFFQLILTFISYNLSSAKLSLGKILKKPFILLIILIFLGSIIFSTIPYINGGAKNLATMTNAKESTVQSPKINTENIIVVPPETAYYQMQTLIGSLPNPSLYKIGQLSLTRTNKGAYYVAPIDIEGGIKALLNRELPGVAYVSAEKLEPAKLISIPHKYGHSLVFNNDLYRKLRQFSPTNILLNANIELDEDLNPYYVGSYGHYKYGRKGVLIDGVIVYDLKNNEFKKYKKDEVPQWVDQVYTCDLAVDYNNYFGRLQKGLLNSLIGQKGVHIPTNWGSNINLAGLEIESNQVVPVVGSNGEFYYFTDHTNTSNVSTTMTGFTLLNTRNGEFIYYTTPGYLNGQGAMNTVEKLLGANKANWSTAQPILYNIYGIDTWIIPVINKTDGSFVKLGLVTAQTKFSILADSKLELIDSFKKAIADGSVNENSDVKVNNNSSLKEVETVGKITRINQSIEDGKSIFYFKIDSIPNKIFMVNKNVNADVVLSKEGDNIKIKYIEMTDQKIIPVTSFEAQ